MKEYTYYWYHHMMPEEDRKEIEQVLAEKDYEAFVELYKKYSILAVEYGSYNEEFETWFPMTFLPDYIGVYDTETEELEDEDELFICLSPEWVPSYYHPLFFLIVDYFNSYYQTHFEIY